MKSFAFALVLSLFFSHLFPIYNIWLFSITLCNAIIQNMVDSTNIHVYVYIHTSISLLQFLKFYTMKEEVNELWNSV